MIYSNAQRTACRESVWGVSNRVVLLLADKLLYGRYCKSMVTPTHIQIYEHTSTHTNRHTSTHMSTHTHTHEHTSKHTHTSTHTHEHVHAHTRARTSTHTHTHSVDLKSRVPTHYKHPLNIHPHTTELPTFRITKQNW